MLTYFCLLDVEVLSQRFFCLIRMKHFCKREFWGILSRSPGHNSCQIKSNQKLKSCIVTQHLQTMTTAVHVGTLPPPSGVYHPLLNRSLIFFNTLPRNLKRLTGGVSTSWRPWRESRGICRGSSPSCRLTEIGSGSVQPAWAPGWTRSARSLTEVRATDSCCLILTNEVRAI